MSYTEFVHLVERMREAQRKYYLLRKEDPARKQRALMRSKILESEVDKAVSEMQGLFPVSPS